MRKIIAILALGAALVSCKWNGEFTIKGQIEGFDMFDEVELMVNDEVIASSAVATDGSFEFTGKISQAERAIIIADEAPIMVVYLDGSSIKVGGVVEDDIFEATGTPCNDAATTYKRAQQELYETYFAATTDDERTAVEKQLDALATETISKNNNLFGLIVLGSNTYSLTGEEIIAKLDKFSEELQNSQIGKTLRDMAESKMKTEPGNQYIDIALTDKDGNEIKLSDYVGKGYILIDFWASWCGPCMEELPYLLDSYARYHDKGFEIFAISLDSDKDAWLKAIEDNKMTWIQTSRLMNLETTATEDYAVSGIPANYLIAPNGEIVAKNLRGAELLAKLTELVDK